MKDREYVIMNKFEDIHWWYNGLRGFLTSVFQIYKDMIPENPIFLDVGCGTGANIKHITDYFRSGKFSGFDLNPISLKNAKIKNPSAEIYCASLISPQLRGENYDLITILDVLYMTGIENSLDGLRIIMQHLKPGGIVIFNNPSYNWLFSEHDQAVHTLERYTKKDMIRLCSSLELIPLRICYRNFFLFPFVVLYRLPRFIFKRKRPENPKSDIKDSNKILNYLFTKLVQLENWGFKIGINYPWGSSVIIVARKKL
jgi:SAM-dependent methyltransferase